MKCSRTGCVYIPPFDHPDIWAGNSTIVDELKQQLPHKVWR